MRKGISKKIRFEVFKRDSFTCQYCGEMAPDVILHIDHIKPVADGGSSDIINLITSCMACNQGKGARKLSDKTEIKKQQQQIKNVNERRLQLEMLMNWRSSMKSEEEQKIDAFCEEFASTGRAITDFGRKKVGKWLKKNTISEILSALDICIEQYASYDEEGRITPESASKIFSYIPRVAAARKRPGFESMQPLYYIRGILNNRLAYVNQHDCISILKDARDLGVDIDSMQEFSKSVRTWTSFKAGIEEMIKEAQEYESA